MGLSQVEFEPYQTQNGLVQGLRWELQNAPTLILHAPGGCLMCGCPNVADKMGDAAARASGASSFDDMMRAEASVVTSAASALGMKEGITGEEATSGML